MVNFDEMNDVMGGRNLRVKIVDGILYIAADLNAEPRITEKGVNLATAGYPKELPNGFKLQLNIGKYEKKDTPRKTQSFE